MLRLKSIKIYFFSILKLSFLSFRNYYFRSSFYNNKLITFTPYRIFYKPSSYLAASLTTTGNEFYKITETSSKILWKINTKEKLKFENLHSFLWLTKLDRKNSKVITKSIISSWMNNFFDYNANVWKMKIIATRVIAWASNVDITLEDSDKVYRKKFFLSLVKQSNFLLKNLNNLPYGSNKIICCAAIILSGIIFKENEINYKIGVLELEKIIKNYFDESGFPKSRNPEDVFTCIKYLILIREWFKEAQISIPDFLNKIIQKCGSCYLALRSTNKQFPLFNGATEINYGNYDIFLKTLKYKFIKENNEFSGFYKIKKKKIEIIIDCGNPPPNNFAKHYQAGCLSFELIANRQKIICNSGYGKYLSTKLAEISRSTASHSTLYLNDTSSCIFQKNKFINKIYENSLIHRHKIIEKNYKEDDNFYSLLASHNGYEKKFGYIHTRSIKVSKKKDIIYGQDKLKKIKNILNPVDYFIRFHIYPGIKIVKTKAGNSIIISLSNGDGWILNSKTNEFKIEKNIFLGNKNKIINNESIVISDNLSKEITLMDWTIERVN